MGGMQGFGIRHTLNPNPYTGAFGNDGRKYAEDVKDVISTCTPGGVAGFIAETIQGVGGSVPLADGYLPAAYEVGACVFTLHRCIYSLLQPGRIRLAPLHYTLVQVC